MRKVSHYSDRVARKCNAGEETKRLEIFLNQRSLAISRSDVLPWCRVATRIDDSFRMARISSTIIIARAIFLTDAIVIFFYVDLVSLRSCLLDPHIICKGLEVQVPPLCFRLPPFALTKPIRSPLSSPLMRFTGVYCLRKLVIAASKTCTPIRARIGAPRGRALGA